MVMLGQEANESVGVVWWSSIHSSPLVRGVHTRGNAFLSTITTIVTSTHFQPVERLFIPEDFTSLPKSLEGIKPSLFCILTVLWLYAGIAFIRWYSNCLPALLPHPSTWPPSSAWSLETCVFLGSRMDFFLKIGIYICLLVSRGKVCSWY